MSCSSVLRSSILVGFARNGMVFMMASSGSARWLGYLSVSPLCPHVHSGRSWLLSGGLVLFSQGGNEFFHAPACRNIYHPPSPGTAAQENWLGVGSVTRTSMYMTQKYLVLPLFTTEIMTFCLIVWTSKEFNLPCRLDPTCCWQIKITRQTCNTDLCQINKKST